VFVFESCSVANSTVCEIEHGSRGVQKTVSFSRPEFAKPSRLGSHSFWGVADRGLAVDGARSRPPKRTAGRPPPLARDAQGRNRGTLSEPGGESHRSSATTSRSAALRSQALGALPLHRRIWLTPVGRDALQSGLRTRVIPGNRPRLSIWTPRPQRVLFGRHSPFSQSCKSLRRRCSEFVPILGPHAVPGTPKDSWTSSGHLASQPERCALPTVGRVSAAPRAFVSGAPTRSAVGRRVTKTQRRASQP
jgi:hypothetical protein